jgi:hypothetical protein
MAKNRSAEVFLDDIIEKSPLSIIATEGAFHYS